MPNIVQQYNFNRISSSADICQVFGWLSCACDISTVSTGTLGYSKRAAFGSFKGYKIDINADNDIVDIKIALFPVFTGGNTNLLTLLNNTNITLGSFFIDNSNHTLFYHNAADMLVATSDFVVPNALINLEFVLNKTTGTVDAYLNGDTENKLLSITNQTFVNQFRYIYSDNWASTGGFYIYDIIIATGASNTIIGNTAVKDYSMTTITENNTFVASNGTTDLLTILGAAAPTGDTLYAKAADAPALIAMTPADLLDTDLNLKAVSIVADWKKYGDGDCNARIDYTIDGTNTITGTSVTLCSSYLGKTVMLGTLPTPAQFDNNFKITLRRTA